MKSLHQYRKNFNSEIEAKTGRNNETENSVAARKFRKTKKCETKIDYIQASSVVKSLQSPLS